MGDHSSPEIFMAVAAARTRRIMLGSGVVSVPYHHPFHIANRFALLDHLTGGRVMLGCGPGALAADAHMLGIDTTTQRRRMVEGPKLSCACSPSGAASLSTVLTSNFMTHTCR